MNFDTTHYSKGNSFSETPCSQTQTGKQNKIQDSNADQQEVKLYILVGAPWVIIQASWSVMAICVSPKLMVCVCFAVSYKTSEPGV